MFNQLSYYLNFDKYNKNEVYKMKFEEYLLESEINILKKELKQSDIYLKAPNGKESNLPEKQWLIVRTKSFKNWFGDWETDKKNSSKVIDENGEPMIMYHGSKAKFDTFDEELQKNGWLGKGFYFTPSLPSAKSFGRSLHKTFLNIRNVFSVNGNSGGDFSHEVSKLTKSNVDIDMTKPLKDHGYDGVYIKHWDFGVIYTVFKSNQIKTITNTAFTTSNNINECEN